MAIITISGRRVKRPVKNAVPATSRGRTIWTRQAKALAPWAGPGYLLTEAGEAAMVEVEAAQSFERRQSACRALELNALAEAGRRKSLADVKEIQRRYTVSHRCSEQGEYLGEYVDFDGTVNGDFASVIVTGNPDNPFQGVMRGTQVHLPAEAFELAAQLWLAIQSPAGKEAAYVD